MSPEPALTGPGPEPIVLPEPPPAADAPAAPDDQLPKRTPTWAIPAPRDCDDRSWEHPADGGEPLDGHALWTNNTAFGRFQTDGDFPDDVAQAMRVVLERMHRAGFRGWEAEWDYVECGYWFLRRNLELNAREAFRLWYGEGEWQTPYRMASHLQEAGQLEYRIDHLLQSELGVAVRTREVPLDGAVGQAPRTRADAGEVLGLLEAVMAPGEFLTVPEIVERLRPVARRRIDYMTVFNCCHSKPDRFGRRGGRGTGSRVQFALRPR